MKALSTTHDVHDLAHGLAALAADILDCEIGEIDLSMEAPAPLEDVTLRLGWEIVQAESTGSDATSSENVAAAAAEGDAAADEGAPGETAPSEAAPPSPTEDSPRHARPPAGGGRSSSNGDRPRSAPAARSDDEVGDADLDEEADAAADFVEGLLDALDLPGDLKIEIENGNISIEVVDLDSGALIGRRGQTLEAIQEMLRASMQRQFQRRSRVILDIEGYRRRRLEKFLEHAEEAIAEVLETGSPVRLEPMDVYERKQVHQLVAQNDGLVSRSQGREPARRIVIEPA